MEYYPWLYWLTIGLHCISSFIISTVILYYLAQYIFNPKDTENIRLGIKILTIIGSIACLICAISDGLTVYIDKSKSPTDDIYYNSQAISHAINNLMTYFIYIYRLHLSFKDTMYRLGTLKYAILITFITLDLLDFVGDSLAYSFDPNILLYLDTFGLFTETVICAMCLYLFNKNLFSLMLKMKTSIAILEYNSPYSQNHHYNYQESPYSYSQGMGNKENLIKSPIVSYDDDNNKTNNGNNNLRIINEKPSNMNNKRSESMMDQLNERQRRLIDRIVRNALLCSLTMLFWTIERVGWFLFIFEPNKLDPNLMFVAKCLTSIALMIDAVCMLFTFKFATLLYNSFCKSCDKCCHQCCQFMAAKYADRHETL